MKQLCLVLRVFKVRLFARRQDFISLRTFRISRVSQSCTYNVSRKEGRDWLIVRDKHMFSSSEVVDRGSQRSSTSRLGSSKH